MSASADRRNTPIRGEKRLERASKEGRANRWTTTEPRIHVEHPKIDSWDAQGSSNRVVQSFPSVIVKIDLFTHKSVN